MAIDMLPLTLSQGMFPASLPRVNYGT